jgi:hypothetical protein
MFGLPLLEKYVEPILAVNASTKFPCMYSSVVLVGIVDGIALKALLAQFTTVLSISGRPKAFGVHVQPVGQLLR